MGFVYEREINYYETDKMGIVHHSNYIRFLEEARCAWLKSIGLPYAMLEENGITIPVLGVECEYKHHITYSDIIIIELDIEKYNGVRMDIKYTITDKSTKKVVLIGQTKHCFTNIELKPVNLKKYKSEFSEKFEGLI